MLRIASAVVLVALVITTIWVLPPWGALALAIIAAGLAGAELAGISSALGANVPAAFVSFGAATVVAAFARDGQFVAAGAMGSLAAVLLVLVVAAGTVALALGPPSPSTLTRAAVMVMGPLYIGLPLGVFAWLQAVGGPGPTTWLLAVIAVSDSAQYYTGRALGRVKLAPAISPAKTREGAMGGVVAAAIAGFLLGPLWLPAFSAGEAAGIAVLLAMFGMAGDLFESLLKRSAGLKDSSTLIPGHGGILDRLDSHLFAAPVFYVCLRLLS